MPKYIEKLLQKYEHVKPKRPQHSPYPVAPRKWGAVAQEPLPEDGTPSAGKEGVTKCQQVVGSVQYYARGVDATNLPALSTLGSEQTRATKQTMSNLNHLMDYLATHPDAKIRYYASDMILNVHSDASYLSESQARSRASGHYFLGSMPKDGEPIRLNGSIFDLCVILKFVAASAAEAELGALFLNVKQVKILRLTLEELGHPQPPTPIHCDNNTAVGIANGTVKKQRSRSFEMRYFWICDQVTNKHVLIVWHPGLEKLGDYNSKHHDAQHHVKVRPIYLHCHNSPRFLPRASKPSDLRGCVGNSAGGYARGRPLPSIPMGRSQASHRTRAQLAAAAFPSSAAVPAAIHSLPKQFTPYIRMPVATRAFSSMAPH